MKAKLLVSTAFLAASVSLSAQRVLPSLYMPTKAKKSSRRKSTVNLPNTWVHVSTVVFG